MKCKVNGKYRKYRDSNLSAIGWIVTILGSKRVCSFEKYFFDDGTAFEIWSQFSCWYDLLLPLEIFLLVLVVVLELRGRTFGHYKCSLWIQNIGVVHEGCKYHEHIKKITLSYSVTRTVPEILVHTREVLLNQISAVANVGLATTAGVVDKTNDKTNGSECSTLERATGFCRKTQTASMLIDNPLQHGRRVESSTIEG